VRLGERRRQRQVERREQERIIPSPIPMLPVYPPGAREGT
jgi:hypothetical protein